MTNSYVSLPDGNYCNVGFLRRETLRDGSSLFLGEAQSGLLKYMPRDCSESPMSRYPFPRLLDEISFLGIRVLCYFLLVKNAHTSIGASSCTGSTSIVVVQCLSSYPSLNCSTFCPWYPHTETLESSLLCQSLCAMLTHFGVEEPLSLFTFLIVSELNPYCILLIKYRLDCLHKSYVFFENPSLYCTSNAHPVVDPITIFLFKTDPDPKNDREKNTNPRSVRNIWL